ncbi:hypothetical protein J2741_002401 [Methanolinea mesophila]|nr:hypothetical protein [Methanolinea mesophila]
MAKHRDDFAPVRPARGSQFRPAAAISSCTDKNL